MDNLRKSERLNRKILIDKMFMGGSSRSFSVFPLRVVYMPAENQEEPVSILISVSKRRFKRAVKRNRVKRQIRESYRKNKAELSRFMVEKEQNLAVAFIYLSDQLISSAEIEAKIKLLLTRMIEKLA